MTGSATRPCPICGKPTERAEHRPFCSPRCRQVDLARWLGEAYRIPGPPVQPNGEGEHDDDGEAI
jgi:hypothetical protein